MTRLQRFAWVAAAMLSAAMALSGCGVLASSPPPSGAHDPDAVAAREFSDAKQVELLHTVAGREPLSVRRGDTCRRGQDNWKIHDGYDWMCVLSVSWVLADETADPAVLIAGWKARLVEVGCEPDEADFDMVESYWQMFGVAGQYPDGAPYTIDDLPSVTALCGSDYIGIWFSTPHTVDIEGIGTYPDGELITDEPLDVAKVRGSTQPHVVVIATSDNYHSVPGYEEPTPAVDDGYCACYSGSTCDCPGG